MRGCTETTRSGRYSSSMVFIICALATAAMLCKHMRLAWSLSISDGICCGAPAVLGVFDEAASTMAC